MIFWFEFGSVFVKRNGVVLKRNRFDFGGVFLLLFLFKLRWALRWSAFVYRWQGIVLFFEN
jgi:hypothetical protein